MIAFASCFPGSIKAFEIGPGQEMVFQKSAFLASEAGVELSVFFNKKFSSGLFGGEGFVMQKVTGHGTVFAEFDGHVAEYELRDDQEIVVDTGHLAAMTASCQMEIKSVPGVKNYVILAEKEFFNTVIHGPGKVWLQTMPISNVAGALRPYMHHLENRKDGIITMRTRSIHKAALTDAVTPLEEAGKEIAYQAAVEGIVLLENDGCLPLKPGKIALYGAGAKMTIKGGTGSGEVNERHAVSILEGMEDAGFKITTMNWIDDYDQSFQEGERAYAEEFRKKLSPKNLSDFMNLMSSPYRYPYGRAVLQEDVEKSETDTCIYVISRQAGEGADRKLSENEYGLAEIERVNLTFCAEQYEHMIVVINVGGVFDLNFLNEISGINAVIFMGELGTMGGLALADVISGKQTPSGKLTDTWAKHYRDLPFADEYSYLNGNLDEEYYREGIYVGYRYFDTFHVTPRYPFGYGMSYTNFAIRFEQMQMEGTKIHVYTEVENTGRIYDGKEVVQIYVSCPNGELKKEAQRLTAFHKTKLLKPGEKEKLILSFDLRDMTSYREKDAATVLEKGEYVIRLGNSSRNTRVCGILRLSSEIITEKHSHICKIPMHVTELEQKEEDILHATCDCRQNWGRGCEIIIENMEKNSKHSGRRG